MKIKFRAFDKKEKVMRPKHGVISMIEFDQNNEPVRIGVREWIQTDEDGNCDWDAFTLEKGEFELTQYTGLKDKNGKEIYGGYIVRRNEIYYNDEFHIYFVKWGKCSYNLYENGNFRSVLDIPLANDVEVIGNIFENPELIEL